MPSLITLPLSIQSRILSYLCPHEALHPRNSRWKPPFLLSFRDPPVTISLACAPALTVLLPGELLSPAQASPILATAAANLLGSRVSYLTTWNTGDRLTEWATTFAPYVKAVSTWHPFGIDPFDDWNHGVFSDYRWDNAVFLGERHLLVLERQMQSSMPLFKALSIDAVTLEVLDLTDVPFPFLEDMEDELFGGLCTTLECNSATLRELALPVFYASDITEKALEMSTLKKLDVLTVKLCCLKVSDPSNEVDEHPFVRMIRALDGHADRNRKLSTISELRLLNVNNLPCRDHLSHLDPSACVLHVIKKLRVAMCSGYGQPSQLDVPFISLFKNLKRLFWGGMPYLNETRLVQLCTTLSEVHICGSDWITSAHVGGRVLRVRQWPSHPFHYYTDIRFTENHTSRAIRTLRVGHASRRKVRRLIQSCPNLEFLSLTVTIKNAACLTRLLSKCEQVEGLEILISIREFSRFGGFYPPGEDFPACTVAEGWRSLSRIIPEPHKNLRQLAIHTANISFEPPVKCMETMVDCFEKTVRAVGARARRISFLAKVKPRRNAVVLEQLCRLLKVFIQYTPALESLELDFPIDKDKQKGGGWNWDDSLVRRLFHLRNQLLRNVPSLRMLDLGIWHGLSKPLDRDDDRLKLAPVPIRSRRESNGS